MLDTGYWILDTGYGMLDAGCWMLTAYLDLCVHNQRLSLAGMFE